MAVINIPLDPDLAKVYEGASAEDQHKIQVLLSLWLREIADPNTASLNELMDSISDRAQKRGLTPEILDENT